MSAKRIHIKSHRESLDMTEAEYSEWLMNNPDIVYVGRDQYQSGYRLPKSPWHNPFLADNPKKRDGTREEVVAKFRRYIHDGDVADYQGNVHDGRHLRARLGELEGNTLACWCPLNKPCHGDVLIELIDSFTPDINRERRERFIPLYPPYPSEGRDFMTDAQHHPNAGVDAPKAPELVAPDDITIVDKLAEFAPQLTLIEYQALASDIRAKGIQHPLIVSRRGDDLVLLDGHNRLRIAKKLGMEQVPIRRESLKVGVWRGGKQQVIDLSDEPDAGTLAKLGMDYGEAWLRRAELYALWAQLGRRNLTMYSKITMTWKAREGIYREAAEAERKQRKTEDKIGALRLDERLAQDCGVSKQTAQRAKWLLEKAPQEYKEKLQAGEMDIGTAYRELNNAEEKKAEAKKPVELKAGKQVRSRVPALLKTFNLATPDNLARDLADKRPEDLAAVREDVDALLKQLTYFRDRLQVEAERMDEKDAA